MDTPMKSLALSSLAGAPLMLPVFAAGTADAAHGKSRHEDKCSGCHGTRLYTCPNHKIHNLQARVEFCNNAAKTGFNPQGQTVVIQYLNRNFYKFHGIQ